jgi:hypothetical protein
MYTNTHAQWVTNTIGNHIYIKNYFYILILHAKKLPV